MEEDEVERFEVETDGGERYTLSLIQEYRTFRPLSGPIQRIATLKRYDVWGGGHANYKDGVVFEIVATGEMACRIA